MSRFAKQLLASGAALVGGAAMVALAQPGPAPVPGLAPTSVPGMPAAGMMQLGTSGAGQFMPMPSPQQPSMPQAAAPKPQPPRGPTQLIDLPRIDNRAISELIAGLVTRFELESAYSVANAAQEQMLPVPAKVVAVGPVLARVDAQKKTLLMRFGFLRQPGQLPQLWVSGMAAPDRSAPNVDVALVEPAVAAILASRDKSEADLPITELRSQVINLAYIDADSAVGMLKAMGFNVSGVERPWNGTQPGAAGNLMGGAMPVQMPPQQSGWGMQQAPLPGFAGGWGSQQPTGMQGQVQQFAPGPVAGNRRVRNAELPMVIRMPGPNPQDVGLVGAAADGSGGAPGTGQSGLTTILGATSRLSTETLSSPTTQLMVMYNPDRPEQLGLVRKAIMESIDTPARQLVIEAMVLEVTSNGLRDLGLTWNYQKGFNSLAIGSLLPGSGVDTLSFTRDMGLTQALVKSFFVKVQALVQSGKAEVLARPSVLTLDNRQATIRVGTDIPIATSRDGPLGAESRVSYSFFYLPTGIQLNVRPRIDNDGSEVSLQIDAAVSTTVANLGAQIRSPGDVVLAAAPAVSTRRVQTYARIPNSTPLIIGGLISRTRDEVKDSTPVLGEVPLIGALFGGKKETSTRDEVIIVLTPYVLERGRRALESAMPKDAPAFEYSRDNELFRKNMRLRAEDTLSTAYIRGNARLLRYRKLVNRIAAGDPSRVENTPLALVRGSRIPGEQTLMMGVLYHALRKHYDGNPVPPERMQLFLQREEGEVVVRSLASVLTRMGDGRTPESFFRTNPDKCLAITFASHREELAARNVLAEPEPVTRLVNCKRDRSDWASLLYELNRRTQEHNFRTILIKDESDLLTLSHSIALRRLIQINGGKATVDLEHMGIGRVLAMPEFGPSQDHLLEADIALYFYLSQHYYRAFEEDFEQGMSAIEKLLRSGQLNDVILPNELPPVSR